MSLVSMKVLLEQAAKGNYGIGAFSIADMEMIMGVIKAAEEKKSPVILQIAQTRLRHSPLHLIAPVMLAAAKSASVPVAVHFDHGLDLETIGQALDLGFTSVMIDASHLPIEENIKITKEVKKLAESYGADVEAEVGQLAGSEDGSKDLEMFFSNPLEVKALYENTGVDAIALSIGNAHGLYKKEPKLNFAVLQSSKEMVPVPLVLHGGSGISDDDFCRCVREGIRKVNIATAGFMAVEGKVRKYCENESRDYFKMVDMMVEGAYENTARHINIFGSDNKA